MKRLIILSVSLMLLLLAVIGNTFAYLTDIEMAENVIVVGNVDIVQLEHQRAGDGTLEPFENDKNLIPGVYYGYSVDDLPMDGEFYDKSLVSNAVDKIVSVENKGRSDVFIRTLFAFEQGSVSADDFNEILIINRNNEDWTWNLVGNGIVVNDEGEEKIYTVYCAVYDSPLAPGTVSESSLRQVLFSSELDSDCCDMLDSDGDGKYAIEVVTQAVQTAGFNDAVTALDTAFGQITASNHPWA